MFCIYDFVFWLDLSLICNHIYEWYVYIDIYRCYMDDIFRFTNIDDIMYEYLFSIHIL